MASEIVNEAQISLIVNDLIKDLDELKEVSKSQGERIGYLENGQRELNKKTEELETKVTGIKNSLETIPKAKALPFEVVLEQKVTEIKDAIQKRPNIHQESKFYSVFGNRFDAQNFRVVVDTIMKWMVILIGSFAVISIVKFLIHFQ